MPSDKKVTITFARSALDNFDGTQEELDNFIQEITDLALSGNLLKNSEPVDMDRLAEDDPEAYETLMCVLNNQPIKEKRRLH
jgi:hypothetical protein